MKKTLWLGIVLALFASTISTAEAQDVITFSGPGGTCVGEAACLANAQAAWESSMPGGPAETFVSVTGYWTNTPGYWLFQAIVVAQAQFGQSNYGYDYIPTNIPAACDNFPAQPECPEQTCPFVDGEEFIKSGEGSSPPSFCDQGCSFTPSPGGANVNMDGGWIGSYSVSGSCSPDDANPPDTDLNCISDGVTQYCADTTSPQNCGTVNGEYVCLDSVPEGNCLLTPDGQAICDAGSQTNTPDNTISDNAGNQYDIYGAGSPTGGTAGGGGTTSGTNDTDGDGVPNGNGTGGQGEDEPTNIQGPSLDDDGRTFQSVTNDFYDTISGGPWAQAVGGISGANSGQSCPSGSFTFFGETFNLDGHCSLLDQAATVLAALFLALWIVLGARVILEA